MTSLKSVVTLGIEGAYQSAQQSYLNAASWNPTNPNIPFRMARLEVLVGNVDEAKQLIDASLARKTNYNPAYMLASQIALNEGNMDLAIRTTELGALSSPQDIAAFFQLGYLRIPKW